MSKRTGRITTIIVAIVVVAIIIGIAVLAIYSGTQNALSSQRWAADIIERYYYLDIGEEIDYENMTIDEMVDTYLDRYSAYYTYEEYLAEYDSNSGSKEGLGVSLSDTDDGILVNYVYGNSPAYAAGLRPGDIIESITIGGSSIPIVRDTASELVSYISNLSSSDTIYIHTRNGVTDGMNKASYQASYVFMYTNEYGYSISYEGSGYVYIDRRPEDRMDFLPDGAACLSILQFYGYADYEMGLMLGIFNDLGLDTLYLDLRNNGGGYLSVLQGISGYFIDETDVVTYAEYRKYGSGDDSEYYATKVDDDYVGDVRVDESVKIYVLANNGTASASEAFMGMLVSYGFIDYCDIYISDFSEDYLTYSGTTEKNGRTYGKGIMQKSYMNSSTGEVLKLTVATLVWPNGNCIHDIGFTEDDGCNLVEASWSVTSDDEELQLVVAATAS